MRRPGLDGTWELRFGNGAIQFDRIRAGDRVWRTADPDLARVAKPFLEAAAPVARQVVRVHVTAAEGSALTAEWSVGRRCSVVVRARARWSTRRIAEFAWNRCGSNSGGWGIRRMSWAR